MKARFTADLDTTGGTIKKGTVVEGDHAVRAVAAGYAVPVVEAPPVETATAKPDAKVEVR